ncbi:MAG: LLM class F420-dependent oxidoreductase [Microbacterium sp. 67-17]|uniref:LLM class F420-dependent oxidoreductase n=1 Tax=Microbacterium sp. 67-17 TaxID=1895782 RepID=UPI000967152E|nr:LLM class F420-dependent oxidoreductase [Microbacterium sp. 67-17]OJV98967.1 MAG: LLM class F420-dependent oxidoreductase [Microbacterium sp. 67-17]
MTWTDRLGEFGVWRRSTDIEETMAVEVERLGYGTIWLGGSPAADLVEAERLLDTTESIVLATGIVNIWMSDATELAESYHRIVARHPGRLLLGIGSGHRERQHERARPLEAMSSYLDVLDAAGVPQEDRLLSALGPRMLELARTRSAGTHPYLTLPAQTAEARETLGNGVLVAPEQTVVLDTDPVSARKAARAFLTPYLGLNNYTNTMKRGGFSDDDVQGSGSDDLVDRIVVHGDAATLLDGLRAHLDAGADHVCVQGVPSDSALEVYRAVAPNRGAVTRP